MSLIITHSLACQPELKENNRIINMRFSLREGRIRFTAAIAAIQVAAHIATANDNGLALAPPMGWRNWNQYEGDVDQDLMEHIMEGMVRRSRTDHLGVPT